MMIAAEGRAEGTGKGAEGAVWIKGVVHDMTVACDVIVFKHARAPLVPRPWLISYLLWGGSERRFGRSCRLGGSKMHRCFLIFCL